MTTSKGYMNKKTTDGKLAEVKGSVKEALGKVIGNDGLAAEGAIEKEQGRKEKNAGKAEKSAKNTAKKHTK